MAQYEVIIKTRSGHFLSFSNFLNDKKEAEKEREEYKGIYPEREIICRQMKFYSSKK